MNLSEEQKKAVNFPFAGHLLVKGIAGSGKSTVLIKRAAKLLQTRSGETVRVITFNRALTQYYSKLNDGGIIKEASTFHSWALKIIKTFKGSGVNVIQRRERKKVIKDAIERFKSNYHDHRLFQQSIDFWEDEFDYIKGKRLLNKQEYIGTNRSGRGSEVRVTKKDKELVYEVFNEYSRILNRRGLIDFSDFANILLDKQWEIPDKLKVDHLFIDEAQDLQASQILALSYLARKSITIGADKGQNIYKTGFTWKEVNIDIRGGRTKTLTNTFRSTDEIVKLAISLQKHDNLVRNNDEEYTMPNLPNRSGPVPELMSFASEEEEKEAVAELVHEIINEDSDLSIGILARTWAELDDFKKVLDGHGVDSVIFKASKEKFFDSGVQLITYHSAKGLEFDIVFATGLIEGNLPPKEIDYLSGEDFEEYLAVYRRLVYVAITRAKNCLFMTCGGKLSRFVEEMDPELYLNDGEDNDSEEQVEVEGNEVIGLNSINEKNKVDEVKECPFCAEKIKLKAIKCKHCKSFVDQDSIDEMSRDGGTIGTFNENLRAKEKNGAIEKLEFDNATYEGEVIDGIPHGHGILIFDSGAKYVGEFNNGIYHGQGSYTFPNDSKYVGEYKNHKRHGFGTYYGNNGSKYVGEFKDGKMHGQGMLNSSTGEVKKGLWENGSYMGSFK